MSENCDHKNRISEVTGMGHITYEVCADCGYRFDITSPFTATECKQLFDDGIKRITASAASD